MTTLQEAAMRQAIAALEESKRHLTDAMREAAIDRLCDALAQQGEPVVLSDDVLDFELRGYLTSLTFWYHLPVDDADELAAFFVKFLRERPRNWRQVNAAAPAPQAQQKDTLQEAARKALYALEASIDGDHPYYEDQLTAIESLRTALAQQEADKPFQPDWVNYRQGVEDGKAEALLAQQGEQKPIGYVTPGYFAFGQGMIDERQDEAKCVPVYAAAPAPVAQQGEQQQVVKEVVVHADYRAMWQEVTRQNQQLCAALSAAPAPQAQKPAAHITDTHQGPMVWTPEMYDEACTYCDDGEFPVPLYTVAPQPTSGDYALGYAEGFNDACKPENLPSYLTYRPLYAGTQAQQIQEPETAMIDAAMVEMANITPPLRRSECKRLIRAALSAAPAPQAQPDWLLKTTQDLANSIRRRCFPEVPQFQVLDDLAGVISQIDNMTCGMERKSAPQAQPVAQPLTLEQILDIVKRLDETPDMSHVDVLKTFARAIEAAHGIGGKQ